MSYADHPLAEPVSRAVQERICATCRHGQHTEAPPGSIHRQRVCRRYPPMVLLIPGKEGAVGFFQPYVNDRCACGEWQGIDSPVKQPDERLIDSPVKQ